jgi:SAM-dependent methyltransferase
MGYTSRDTISFAQNSFHVTVLDYTESGVHAITQKARALGLSRRITAVQHDVRTPLPFEDEVFDACYSHMLYCLALTSRELEGLAGEVRRVVKPHGLHVYTVRNTNDPHHGTGLHRGEDMYEVGGFIVHFFSKAKVQQLAKGYEIVSLDEFAEGELPRKLFRVILKKPGGV